MRAFNARLVAMTAATPAVSVRSFMAAKKKKAKKDDGTVLSQDEGSGSDTPTFVQPEMTVDIPAWKQVTTILNLDQSLFAPFDLGSINKVNSTPDNKAPSSEDTIEGRYANVLFTTASSREALFDVYEDMMYLSELYSHSESFRQFTENAGVGHKEIRLLNKALLETAPFHETTMKFLEVLAENKRLIYIKVIATKYQKLYQQFNKEEKITIISAEALSSK